MRVDVSVVDPPRTRINARSRFLTTYICPSATTRLNVIPMIAKSKVIQVGSSLVGGGSFSVWAGPCSVESKEQFLSVAKHVRRMGGAGLRGGIFKLRTDPRAF